jgi:hypothetical protein
VVQPFANQRVINNDEKPITVTVTGSGSKDRVMCLSVRKVSFPVGVSLKLARMGEWEKEYTVLQLNGEQPD